MIEKIEKYLSKNNIKYHIEKSYTHLRICTDNSLYCDIERLFDPRYDNAPFLLDFYNDTYMRFKNESEVIHWLKKGQQAELF